MDTYPVDTDIKLGVAYGIEGLKRYDEEAADDWLDLFRVTAEVLTARDYDADSELVERIEEINQYAQEIKHTPVDERLEKFPGDEVQDVVADAEALYKQLV